jgi:hypothetical protein
LALLLTSTAAFARTSGSFDCELYEGSNVLAKGTVEYLDGNILRSLNATSSDGAQLVGAILYADLRYDYAIELSIQPKAGGTVSSKTLLGRGLEFKTNNFGTIRTNLAHGHIRIELIAVLFLLGKSAFAAGTLGDAQNCPNLSGSYACNSDDGVLSKLNITQSIRDDNTAVYEFSGPIGLGIIAADHMYHPRSEFPGPQAKGNCGGGLLGITAFGIDSASGAYIVRDFIFEKSDALYIRITGTGMPAKMGPLGKLPAPNILNCRPVAAN